MAYSTKALKKKNRAQNTNIPALMEALKKLDSALKDIKTNVDLLMKGDGTDPYWNGASANKFYRKAVGNQANNLEDYTTAYNRANAFCLCVEAANKDKE